MSVDGKIYDIGYYFCAKYNSGWSSEDYIYKDFEIDDLDNIEEIMFNADGICKKISLLLE